MNRELLSEKLIEAGRRRVPDETVPLGFESRVMRALETAEATDWLNLWAGGLLRASFVCLALCFAVAGWSSNSAALASSDEYSLGATLEMAMLESIPEAIDPW